MVVQDPASMRVYFVLHVYSDLLMQDNKCCMNIQSMSILVGGLLKKPSAIVWLLPWSNIIFLAIVPIENLERQESG